MISPLLALALADPPAPVLDWSAPPGCPTGERILERAASIMGRPSLEGLPLALSIRGEIRAEPVGFSLAIEVETPTGLTRKRASAEGCAVLGSIAALMVAVAVDPIRTATTRSIDPPAPVRPAVPLPEPAVTVAAEPLVPRRTESTVAAESAPARRERRWIEALLRASGGLGRGLVPRLDGQLSLGAGLRTRGLRAELLVFHVLAQTARYPDAPAVGAEVSAWGGSLRAGPVFERRRLELSTTAGISAAALLARGFGVRVPSEAASAWIALCFVPGLRWRPSPRWALGADVEGELVVRRPAFALDALPTVHRAAPIGVRGTIVLEVRLGPHAR